MGPQSPLLLMSWSLCTWLSTEIPTRNPWTRINKTSTPNLDEGIAAKNYTLHCIITFHWQYQSFNYGTLKTIIDATTIHIFCSNLFCTKFTIMYHKYVLWNNLKKMNLIYFYTQFIVYKGNELEIKAPHIL